jgi:RimJ/RimL family protein N-acetyltransferase
LQDCRIETPRLILRLPDASDAQALMEIHQDPEVMKYVTLTALPGGITVAWRNVAMMIGHWHLRGYGQWTIVEKTSGEIIGRVGPFNPEGWPGVELTWVIRRSRWSCGFATESARAALAWTWNAIQADQILSLIRPDNQRSIRVAEKLGERFDRAEVLNGETMHVYVIHRPASNAAYTSST